MELIGAHVRTLSDTAYAKVPPARPKPLCTVDGRERERMGAAAVSTEVDGLEVQRASGGLSKRLSQVLFPLDALELAFSSE